MNKVSFILGVVFELIDIIFFLEYTLIMKELHFEWDENKEQINIKKHKIDFNEATSVFYDDFAIEFFDMKNSEEEDRFLLLGISSKMKILLICHCHKEKDSIIRIISARKATKKETKFYRR